MESSWINRVFVVHVLQLNKSLKAPMNIMLPEVTQLKADLLYLEHPIKVLDQKDRVMRHKTIKFNKIQWTNHTDKEATWESEDFLCSHNPEFGLP
jgi:peptide deformylase